MSSESDLESALTPTLQTMRIITIALINGILITLGIVIYLRNSGSMRDAPPGFLLTYISLGFAGVLFLAHWYVPRAMEAARRKQLPQSPPADLGPLCALYQTRSIISAALLEAPAFFASIAYLIEGQWLALVVAVMFLLALISKFPTMPKLQAWIERQREVALSERAR